MQIVQYPWLATAVSLGGVGCQRGFHVECFTAYHFRDVFAATAMPSVRSALDLVCASAAENNAFKTRNKPNQSITPVTELTFPS